MAVDISKGEFGVVHGHGCGLGLRGTDMGADRSDRGDRLGTDIRIRMGGELQSGWGELFGEMQSEKRRAAPCDDMRLMRWVGCG